MTTTEVCAELGLSYRVVDYWARVGYLKPEQRGGTGYPRTWPTTEVVVARRMRDLVSEGMTVEKAAERARAMTGTGWPS